jgi:hypothetical protein
MITFTYKNNNKGKMENGKWVAPVVFECVAESIEIADKLYEEKTGEKVSKTANIGLSLRRA